MGIPPDYLRYGLFTQDQMNHYQNLMEGKIPQGKSAMDQHKARVFWEEFTKRTPTQTDSWFMDTFLGILEKSYKSVAVATCMFSETFSRSWKGQKTREEVQSAVVERFIEQKLFYRRFVVSFFNIDGHWYWYILDTAQRVIYTGDSLNHDAFIKDAQVRIQPRPLLRDIIDALKFIWTQSVPNTPPNFTVKAVVCPQQTDAVSCGPYACASVIEFLIRASDESFPTHRYSEKLDFCNDPFFIKQRLVMSFAYRKFSQKLLPIAQETKKEPQEPLAEPEVHGNPICMRAEILIPDNPQDCLVPFELPPAEFFQYHTEKALSNIKNPIEALTLLQPNYFARKDKGKAQSKVLISCEIDESWVFTDYTELLVAVVASLSHVTKKGVSNENNPLNQALTDNVIAKAAIIWNNQRNVLYGRDAWKLELNRTQYAQELDKIRKTERVLVKSHGIWRVTQAGFDKYLKITPPNTNGPCIFTEVQNCKGRKSKSNSQKILSKHKQLELEGRPRNRDKTWIDLVKEALSLTHCPLSHRVILNYLARTIPNVGINAVKQGVNSGKKAVKGRGVQFYEVTIPVEKASKLDKKYCGLLSQQIYSNLTPNNTVSTEAGFPCIVWKPFQFNYDPEKEVMIPDEVSFCLCVTEESTGRVFSVDLETNVLRTRYKLFAGTLIEKPCDQLGQLDVNSMLRFAQRVDTHDAVNIEDYVHFGCQVYRVVRDIDVFESICILGLFGLDWN